MRDSLLLRIEGLEMRGRDEQMAPMFSYVSCEARVPAGHPLRVIRAIVDEALDVMSGDFEALYARVGRFCQSSRRRVFGRERHAP